MSDFIHTGQLNIGEPIYKHIQSGLLNFTQGVFIGNVVSINDEIVTLEKDNNQTKYKIVKRNDNITKYTGAVLYSLGQI